MKRAYCSENVVNDDCSQVEQHARDFIRMLLKLVSSIHQAVENDTRVRKCNILQDNWLGASRIRAPRPSQIRNSDVIVSAISITILILRSQTGEWRMRKSSPEVVDESTSQCVGELGISAQLTEELHQPLEDEFVIILVAFDLGAEQIKESFDVVQTDFMKVAEE